MFALFIALGIASILYFCGIVSYAGLASKFHLFWLALGILFLVIAVVTRHMKKHDMHLPHGIKLPAAVMFFTGVLVFVILEAHIIAGACQPPKAQADYMIILGCQVRGERISKMLKYRLDAALSYLENNEGTTVIVSGGQGAGEELSEALAMQQYLTANGIDGSRIIMEEQSTSTEENIRYSRKLMEENGGDATRSEVIIVSNNFHVSRGVGIAKKQGIENASPLAAKCDTGMMPTYYVREALAVAKDLVAGNMEW